MFTLRKRKQNLPASPTDNTEYLEGGDVIVRYLTILEIDYVFGIPGGSIEPFFDALSRGQFNNGPKVILTRHEAGAAFMADGYARQTGKIGVCCATTGPGATNLVTGVACAYASGIPMLVITAQTPLPTMGRGPFQDSSPLAVDIVGMFQHCTKMSVMVSHPDQLVPLFIKAINCALDNKPGPVHLAIPSNVLRQHIYFNPFEMTHMPFFQQPMRPPPEVLNALINEIHGAKTGVIVIGAEVSDAIDVVLELAEFLAWPIVTTPMGKGYISSDHPLYCGVYGFSGHRSAVEVMSEEKSQLILACGTSMNETEIGSWTHSDLLSERVIHVHSIADYFSRSAAAKLQIKGSEKVILTAVLDRLYEIPKKYHAPQRNYQVAYNFSLASAHPMAPVKPQELFRLINDLSPADSIVAMDAGNSSYWGIHYWQVKQKSENGEGFRVEKEFGSMGWAISNIIGSSLAEQERSAICFTGDGSFLMSSQEITVALEQNLNILFVILNDSSLGMVKQGQALSGAASIANRLPEVNFAQMAAAMGIPSQRVTTSKELQALELDEIFKDNSPFLLDVIIDREEMSPVKDRVKLKDAI